MSLLNLSKIFALVTLLMQPPAPLPPLSGDERQHIIDTLRSRAVQCYANGEEEKAAAYEHAALFIYNYVPKVPTLVVGPLQGPVNDHPVGLPDNVLPPGQFTGP